MVGPTWKLDPTGSFAPALGIIHVLSILLMSLLSFSTSRFSDLPGLCWLLPFEEAMLGSLEGVWRRFVFSIACATLLPTERPPAEKQSKLIESRFFLKKGKSKMSTMKGIKSVFYSKHKKGKGRLDVYVTQ